MIVGSGRGATAKEHNRLIVVFFLYCTHTHTLVCPSPVEGEQVLNASLERSFAVKYSDDGLRRGVHGG